MQKLETKLSTKDICQLAALEPGTAEAPQPPAQFLDQLIESGRGADGVRFLAHALSPESAVRWGWKCIEQLSNPGKISEKKSALDAAKAWLASPVDTTRRAAKQAAEESGPDTPAAALAMAVFFSGGSISPETAPEVPPPPHTCQRLVAGAVTLTVVAHQPENAQSRYKIAIELGLDASPTSP
jgi:hypothetical protein